MSYDHLIARTGRVQNWIDDPTSRLPVSCTVIVPKDSMEGADGIEASWRFVSYALRHGAGVAVHLSKLRPKGDENGQGLVASGPCSFAKIYSTLNEVLRRGGVYKNGAVTLHLDLNHQDIGLFLKLGRDEIPWAKRCVDIDGLTWNAAHPTIKKLLIEKIRSGDVWLNKIRYDPWGHRIYGNVCLEVYLPSRGTCLLQHVNLGKCRPEDFLGAFTYGMEQLCKLHNQTDVGRDNEYLPPNVDRQVGLGFLGLANCLAQEGITYKELGEAWEIYYGVVGPQTQWLGLHEHSAQWEGVAPHVRKFILKFEEAVKEAAKIAREHHMHRAFAIAPTASCSYRNFDLNGYTTAPEIAPPIAREVDRDSGTFGVQSFNYGPVEIASEVGWDNFIRVANCIMRCLRRTGLLHGYSLNTWSDAMTLDEDFIEAWLLGSQTSLYYSLQVMGDVQDKTSAMAALGDDPQDTASYLEGLLKGDDDQSLQCDCQE